MCNTFTGQPPCFKPKCSLCQYRMQCANAKGLFFPQTTGDQCGASTAPITAYQFSGV
jgi:hypothetical protein